MGGGGGGGGSPSGSHGHSQSRGNSSAVRTDRRDRRGGGSTILSAAQRQLLVAQSLTDKLHPVHFAPILFDEAMCSMLRAGSGTDVQHLVSRFVSSFGGACTAELLEECGGGSGSGGTGSLHAAHGSDGVAAAASLFDEGAHDRAREQCVPYPDVLIGSLRSFVSELVAFLLSEHARELEHTHEVGRSVGR